MTIRVAIYHETSYEYDRPIGLGPQTIRLRPAPHSRTPITAYSLKIEPAGHFLNWQQDPHSNYLARVVFLEKVPRFRVVVDVVAEMTVINPFDFFLEPDAEKCPFTYEKELFRDLTPFRERQEAGPKLQAWLKSIDRTPIRTVDFLVAINTRLSQEIKYLIRMEPGVQSPEETLQKGAGSCRDSGLADGAYPAAPGSRGAVRLRIFDSTQAGCETAGRPGGRGDTTSPICTPGPKSFCRGQVGWGSIPTSGLFAGEGHIPLAATPEPSSARAD